jgi:hypothetical protein
MYRLSFIILIFFGFLPLLAQSPHGDDLVMDCSECHNQDAWTLDYETLQFDHNTTSFQLEGTHTQTDCKGCHSSLIFNEAPSDCMSCHVDIHSQSVGNDCVRCHTSDNWLVFNTPELHEQNGFPLIGVHTNLSCVECHTNESTLIFNPLGNECIECHRDDYLAAQNPNHVVSGFSTDCLECHDPMGFGWDSQNINHDFFPLTQGHDIQDCSLCHNTSNFSDVSADCFACHETDYNQTTDPDHQAANLPVDCIACHTTNPGWMPATIDHEFFPLTMGHDVQDCTQCHINGNYINTPTDCFTCHETDYNQTTDPDHQAANLPTDCVACHSTNPGWMPATLDHEFYPLTLGHDIQDCNECHINGDYSNTPTDCFACHENDYNQTTNPDHQAASFPIDCVACHTTNPGWMPATFDHDAIFPIYSGKHEGEWNDCIDCHTNPNNYSVFTCITCHTRADTDEEHPLSEVPDYIYESNACLQCHPDGSD